MESLQIADELRRAIIKEVGNLWVHSRNPTYLVLRPDSYETLKDLIDSVNPYMPLSKQRLWGIPRIIVVDDLPQPFEIYSSPFPQRVSA